MESAVVTFLSSIGYSVAAGDFLSLVDVVSGCTRESTAAWKIDVLEVTRSIPRVPVKSLVAVVAVVPDKYPAVIGALPYLC